MHPEYRAIVPAEYPGLLSLWDQCFPQLAGVHFRTFLSDVEDPSELQGCFVDGHLVAAAQIVPRQIYYGAGEIDCAYITNVATAPERRGIGLATGCLTQAIEAIQRSDYILSRLLAIRPGPYRKLGWQPDPLAVGMADVPEVGDPLPLSYGIRGATPEDLQDLCAIHTEFNKGRQFAVVRDADYWRRWLCTETLTYLRPTIVCEAGRRVVGYVQFGDISPFANCVAEIAALPSHSGALAAMLTVVAESVRTKGGGTVTLPWPDDPRLGEAADLVFTGRRPHATLAWMTRVFKPDGLSTCGASTPGKAPYTWLADGM